MTRPHPYHPPLPQPAALIRVDTCDTRSHTFRETRTATAQHLRGRRWLHTSATAHWTQFTAYWTYTFSAKERDSETGLSYFGSRYYSSDLSIWLSVDPMAAKYPSLSPYVYCANNPVRCVDPNGEEIGDYYDLNGKWLGRDRNNDNLAYTATSVTKDPDGYVVGAKNKSLLPISNSELLDRATWVCGESGGNSELITSRTQNAGDATSISNAGSERKWRVFCLVRYDVQILFAHGCRYYG